MKGMKPGECSWNYIGNVMAVLLAEYAHVDVSPPIIAGTDKQTPWQMPVELHHG